MVVIPQAVSTFILKARVLKQQISFVCGMFDHSSTDLPFLPAMCQHKYTAAVISELNGNILSDILDSTVDNYKLCHNFINWHSSIIFD
jgi:hypothetical protein